MESQLYCLMPRPINLARINYTPIFDMCSKISMGCTFCPDRLIDSNGSLNKIFSLKKYICTFHISKGRETEPIDRLYMTRILSEPLHTIFDKLDLGTSLQRITVAFVLLSDVSSGQLSLRVTKDGRSSELQDTEKRHWFIPKYCSQEPLFEEVGLNGVS